MFMAVQYVQAREDDKFALADLRVAAMQESLTAVGRFDPSRARDRLLSRFVAENTWKILDANKLLGFYSYKINHQCLWLDDLYVCPESQSRGLGGDVIELMKQEAASRGLPLRLGALRDSPANDFYTSHGFIATHEDAWDIFYEYVSGPNSRPRIE